jgi:imidazoleglycerol-phosphate dehydratase/histidinol-phosphatase
MKKLLFIDRDGTIIREPEDEQVDSLDKLEFLPGVISNLVKIKNELDYEFVMVTNQDGLGTSSFPEDTFWPVQNMMLKVLEAEGISFGAIHIDRTFPEDEAPTRKPGTAMLERYFASAYDLKNSFVIGDRLSDIELAQNMKCKSILISESDASGGSKTDSPSANFVTRSWDHIYKYLKQEARIAEVSRKTSETDIRIKLNLDGSGVADISTGIGFFDHMLEQLARHGGLDLDIRVKGDLEVDEHHTIEDTALALGTAFDRALGSRKNISRYGFLLPMDDALASAAIDFGGRPWLVWDADFNREYIGKMPTEMFSHFFKSFCDAARCNLHVKAEGANEHHKIEAIFKAWAKAIKMAVKRNNDGIIPSTKGTL